MRVLVEVQLVLILLINKEKPPLRKINLSIINVNSGLMKPNVGNVGLK